MARVELTAVAVEDLDRIIVALTLPADTRERVQLSLQALELLPLLGPELSERWSGLRFLLGPWRWMLLVYKYDAEADRVVVIAVQDARASQAATTARAWENG